MSAPSQFPGDPVFLHKLYHDLRGPAAALRDLPEWLREEIEEQEVALPEAAGRILRLMAENAGALDGLLVGFSAWLAAETPPLDPESAQDGAELIRSLPAAAACKLSIDLDPLPLAATDMSLILEQLLSNACRFHPSGCPGVTVTGSARTSSWTLCVRDDGPGPVVEHPDALLAPLARASVGPRKPGAGFGLAIVSRVANRYGASVKFARRSSGKGAAITLEHIAVQSPSTT